MKTVKLLLIFFFIFMLLGQVVLSKQGFASEDSLGENLVRQLWADMKKPDMDAIEKKIAKGFQSIHQYGADNREQEIKLIRGLKLGEYTLSDIQITRNGPVIVATYFVSVEETIMGKRLSKKPAPRLSVFLKTDSGWQWIAHANLKPSK
ncbi:MAG: nuclear transport factor 2 family protein [Deltaproteobacteria bacterium]|jgi:hypothetical protein|nr:MAG: nuclear transport factor 2 family protein [Deltaproteobacteria bacterium]